MTPTFRTSTDTNELQARADLGRVEAAVLAVLHKPTVDIEVLGADTETACYRAVFEDGGTVLVFMESGEKDRKSVV